MKNLSYFALSFVPGIGPILARQLIERIGSAEAIFQEKTRVLEKVPGIGHTLASEIKTSRSTPTGREGAGVRREEPHPLFLPER